MSLLLALTILYPVWLGDEGVSEMCEASGIYEYTHQGETKEFEVHLTSQADMSTYCTNGPAQACIVDDYDIYVTPGVTCTRSMAHELSHGFGMDFVDA